jgi:dynein light chain LC8-type
MAEEQQHTQKDPYACENEHNWAIVESRMPESFEQEAIRVSLAAVDRFKQLKDIAKFIKQEYDKLHVGSGKATEGVYHCVVGKSFASEYAW